jgi:membrane-associated protease RseP (regulator of RpoE activity)
VTFFTLALAGGTFWSPPLEPGPELGGRTGLWRLFVAGLPYAQWVLLILGAHEMGHYAACRWYRVPTTLPFFIPGIPPLGSFGAVIRIRGPIPHRRALFDIAAAGPLAGFVLTLPALALGLHQARPFVVSPEDMGTVRLGEPVLLTLLQRFLVDHQEIEVNAWIGAGWVGLLVTSLNLFPVGQLDGGHAAYAVSRRGHRLLARLTLVALAAAMLAQLLLLGEFPFYLVWFLVLLWMRDRHPRLIDESVPLGPGRKALAILLVVVFFLSFVPVPLYFD